MLFYFASLSFFALRSTKDSNDIKSKLAADYFISYGTRLSAHFSTFYQYDHLNIAGVPTNQMNNLNLNFRTTVSYAFM